MKISYRLAKAEDLDSLVELRILMQIEVNNFNESEVTTKYRDRVRFYFENAINERRYFAAVAVEANRIVGNAGVCFYEKPPSISGGFGKQGYVTNVYTRKSHRGKGIATELMKKLNQLAIDQKVEKLHLGATDDGKGIYESVGYKAGKSPYLEITFASVKAQ